MGVILTALVSILPGFLLQGLQSYLNATTSIAVEGQKTTRSVIKDTVNGLVEIRRAEASVVVAGMNHKVFWIPWLMAAVPLSGWFAWGVLDTAIYDGTVLSDVGTLPPQLKAYADVVWSNIFYAGAGLGSAQVLAGAISRYTGQKRGTEDGNR